MIIWRLGLDLNLSCAWSSWYLDSCSGSMAYNTLWLTSRLTILDRIWITRDYHPLCLIWYSITLRNAFLISLISPSNDTTTLSTFLWWTYGLTSMDSLDRSSMCEIIRFVSTCWIAYRNYNIWPVHYTGHTRYWIVFVPMYEFLGNESSYAFHTAHVNNGHTNSTTTWPGTLCAHMLVRLINPNFSVLPWLSCSRLLCD